MKVSIGVPIYKVAQYIERCTISLLEQTYKDLEFVFVNDCSPDDSISILHSTINRYPHRKSQIKIIEHDFNRGLGAARNTALREMTGDFLVWVDSDDFVARDMVEIVVDHQKKTGADIISFNHYQIYKSGRKLVKIQWPTKKVDVLKAVLMGQGDYGTIWGRLIRRSLYIDNNIQVKEGYNMGEDLQVLPKLLYFASKIEIIDAPLYYYNCCNISSYTASFSENKGIQSLEATKLLYDFFKKNDAQYLDCVLMRRVLTLTGLSYGSAISSEHKDFCRFIREELNLIESKNYRIVSFPRSIALYIKNPIFFWVYLRFINTIKKFFN